MIRLNHFAQGAVLTASAFALSGCGTSPAALEQANHTVGLMSELSKELDEFRRSNRAADAARLESLGLQREQLAKISDSAAETAQASKSAADTKSAPFATKLLADADGLAAIKARSKAQQAAYSDKLAGLLSPLPSTTASIADAQTKTALMGKDLDPKDRFNELLAFAKDVDAGLDAAKKKLADAKEAAAKADDAASAAPAAASAAIAAASAPVVGVK